ncbi:unnamed protein product [Diamesa hyperborea]
MAKSPLDHQQEAATVNSVASAPIQEVAINSNIEDFTIFQGIFVTDPQGEIIFLQNYSFSISIDNQVYSGYNIFEDPRRYFGTSSKNIGKDNASCPTDSNESFVVASKANYEDTDIDGEERVKKFWYLVSSKKMMDVSSQSTVLCADATKY